VSASMSINQPGPPVMSWPRRRAFHARRAAPIELLEGEDVLEEQDAALPVSWRRWTLVIQRARR
jgi:hypothetical protein